MNPIFSTRFSLFKQRPDEKYVVVLSTDANPYLNSRSDWELAQEFSSHREYERYRQEVLSGVNVSVMLHI